MASQYPAIDERFDRPAPHRDAGGSALVQRSPRAFHQMAERHRRRTRRLAASALDALVHRGRERVVDRRIVQRHGAASPRSDRVVTRSRDRSRGTSGNAAGTSPHATHATSSSGSSPRTFMRRRRQHRRLLEEEDQRIPEVATEAGRDCTRAAGSSASLDSRHHGDVGQRAPEAVEVRARRPRGASQPSCGVRDVARGRQRRLGRRRRRARCRSPASASHVTPTAVELGARWTPTRSGGTEMRPRWGPVGHGGGPLAGTAVESYRLRGDVFVVALDQHGGARAVGECGRDAERALRSPRCPDAHSRARPTRRAGARSASSPARSRRACRTSPPSTGRRRSRSRSSPCGRRP